jgi:hypothetical protein
VIWASSDVVSWYSGQILLLPANKVKNMQHNRGSLSAPRLFPPPTPLSALTMISLKMKMPEEVSVCYGMGCYTICSAVHLFAKCKIPREVKLVC